MSFSSRHFFHSSYFYKFYNFFFGDKSVSIIYFPGDDNYSDNKGKTRFFKKIKGKLFFNYGVVIF